jgi:hypothetical protein
LLFLACSTSAHGQASSEPLTRFLPATVESPYGPVSTLEFETGLIRIGPGSLAFHAHEAVKTLKLAEPVWVIGYKTSTLDSKNRPPAENYLCHTFFGNAAVHQPDDPELPPRPMSALYTDAFTPQVRLPEGFAVRLDPEDNLEWMPMFNNRGSGPAEVRMKCELSVIREKHLRKPMRRLYSSLHSVKSPHLYFVPSGRHEQDAVFELPFEGKIHFIGTHIHPYGESIELRNESRGERIWIGSKKTDAAGRMNGMEVFSSVEGYPVQLLDRFRLISTYDNPTAKPVDAMAGVFLFYTRAGSR